MLPLFGGRIHKRQSMRHPRFSGVAIGRQTQLLIPLYSDSLGCCFFHHIPFPLITACARNCLALDLSLFEQV